mmetsp:Transcript_22058/g.69717  ORF Transcript_22058/g.69717 Transcript_22058/m.69717 type:complete len:474 (-) Transcript_22058:297-1718(-)
MLEALHEVAVQLITVVVHGRLVPGNRIEDPVHRGHAAEDARLLNGARVLLRAKPQRHLPGRVEERRGIEAVLSSTGCQCRSHGLGVPRVLKVGHEANDLAVPRTATDGDIEQHDLVRAGGPLHTQKHDVPGLAARAVDEAGDLIHQPPHHEEFMVGDEERLERWPSLSDCRAHGRGARGADAGHLALVGPTQGLQLHAGVSTAPAEGHNLRRAEILGLGLEARPRNHAVAEAHGRDARAGAARQHHGGHLALLIEMQKPYETARRTLGHAEDASGALDEISPRGREERIGALAHFVGAGEGRVVAALLEEDLHHQRCDCLVIEWLDIEVGAEPLPSLELLQGPRPVLELRVRPLEAVEPALPPAARISGAVHTIQDQLVDDAGDGGLARGSIALLDLRNSGQLPEAPERPLFLRVEWALAGLLALVLALHIPLEARARVAKLEHQALGEARKVDGVRVGHEVEGGVEELLGSN